jgi:hypothetical protein
MSGKGARIASGRMLPSQRYMVTPKIGGHGSWYNSKGVHFVQGGTRELQRHSGDRYHK